MKCIVTGGCGFIGSHAVDRLLAENHDVVVIDNCSTGRQSNLDHHKENGALHISIADIGDPKTAELYEGVDIVFHFAALADIVPSIQHPLPYHNSNVNGTIQVLEHARKANVKKVVYAASSSCYGIPDTYPTPEDSEIRPQYPYAVTKNLGEQYCMYWNQIYGLNVCSMRFFNVYGPRARTSGTYGAVFGVFLAQKINDQPFTVVGDGSQTRDFTFVTDIVDACYTAALSDRSNGQIMNVGSGNSYSINRLIELLGGEVIYVPKRPGEPECTFADTTKIKNLLNWSPKVSFETGVAEMLKHIDYWKEAPVWNVESIAEATKDWFKYLK